MIPRSQRFVVDESENDGDSLNMDSDDETLSLDDEKEDNSGGTIKLLRVLFLELIIE